MFAIIRSASIDQDRRGELRRWSYSAMLAAAVHGVAAMAVLAWHITSKPFDPDASTPAPFFIDLVPPPAPPSSEQRSPTREPNRDRGTPTRERANGAAEAGGTVNPDNSLVSFGLQRNEAGREANGVPPEAPVAPAPPDNAVPEAGGADASRALRVDPGPLDTSITVTPSLRQRKAFGAFGRNGMMLLRPSPYPGRTETTHNNPTGLANAPVARGVSGDGSFSHGPGAHLQDRVNAATERNVLRRAERARNGSAARTTNSLGINNVTSSSMHGNAKNAIGVATANGSIGNPKSGTIDGAHVRNAVGMTLAVSPGAHGISVDQHSAGAPISLKSGVSPSSTGFMAAAPPTGILNGHGLARPGTGLVALGGPPKSVSGLLNGSDFHPKHP